MSRRVKKIKILFLSETFKNWIRFWKLQCFFKNNFFEFYIIFSEIFLNIFSIIFLIFYPWNGREIYLFLYIIFYVLYGKENIKKKCKKIIFKNVGGIFRVFLRYEKNDSGTMGISKVSVPLSSSGGRDLNWERIPLAEGRPGVWCQWSEP